jgi:hypothetical protein
VLDAEAAEDLDAALVHADRNAELEFAQRPAQQVTSRTIEVQEIGDRIELLLGHVESVERLSGRESGSHASGSFGRGAEEEGGPPAGRGGWTEATDRSLALR